MVPKAPEGQLVLSEIYKAIHYRNPYYKLEDQAWQKNVRYQLTLNKSFVKGEKSTTKVRRGVFWKLSSDLQESVRGHIKYLESVEPSEPNETVEEIDKKIEENYKGPYFSCGQKTSRGICDKKFKTFCEIERHKRFKHKNQTIEKGNEQLGNEFIVDDVKGKKQR